MIILHRCRLTEVKVTWGKGISHRVHWRVLRWSGIWSRISWKRLDSNGGRNWLRIEVKSPCWPLKVTKSENILTEKQNQMRKYFTFILINRINNLIIHLIDVNYILQGIIIINFTSSSSSLSLSLFLTPTLPLWDNFADFTLNQFSQSS